jgi:hypothetical protein
MRNSSLGYPMARAVYSGCQKDVPIAEHFFATTLMPPSFFRNINMTSGIIFCVIPIQHTAGAEMII